MNTDTFKDLTCPLDGSPLRRDGTTLRCPSGHAFDIRNAQARLKRLKSHPWAGIDDIQQILPS